MFSSRTHTNMSPNPQSQCQVCRAARRLVIAGDQYRTAEYAGQDTKPLAHALQQATALWTAAKDNRHTGAEHEPVVATHPNLEADHAEALRADAAYEATYRTLGW